MNLTVQLATLRKQTVGLDRNEQAKLCADMAKQMAKVGEYNAAAEALAEFWPIRSDEPKVDDLDPAVKATVLLRVGAVISSIGSADQTAGSQERAKDLITRAVEIFEGLGDKLHV